MIIITKLYSNDFKNILKLFAQTLFNNAVKILWRRFNNIVSKYLIKIKWIIL